MKCTNRRRWVVLTYILPAVICCLTGCGMSYGMPYQVDYDISSFNVVSRQETRTAVPFAANLCVAADDINVGNVAMPDPAVGALFSPDTNEILYAKSIHQRLYPASLTKIMTALVALENGQLNQTLVASNAVNITLSGAVLCGLKSGDTMTLDQALRILMVYSANDVGMLIAENIGGTVDHFIEMMNDKAHELGATNTQFRNPHGLPDDEHYTTIYDMYLIFNEALKYDTFNEIIHMSSYQTVYYDGNGKEKEFSRSSSNQFLGGNRQAPANVTVIGGKTGTTLAAGHCLMLLVRDENGSPYIAAVLRADSTDSLYNDMIDLLGEIHK